MNRFEFLVGLNDKDGHVVGNLAFRIGESKRLVSTIFGGATFVQVEGVWEDSIEPSLAIIVVTAKPAPIAHETASLLAEVFGQQSVMLNESHVVSGLFAPRAEAELFTSSAEIDEIANAV